MLDILKVFVEKVMDAALNEQGVKGVVAQFFLYVFVAIVTVLLLYILGMPQFRRDAGAVFAILLGVHVLVTQILPVKDPYLWLRRINGAVIVLGIVGLVWRIVTGNWEPVIPEYVPQ